MTIRIVSLEDAEELLSIYSPYVENTAISFEYTTPSLEEFTERIRTISARYPYLVLEDDTGKIQGYAYAGSFKEREAYDWSVETTIYIRLGEHGKGYGRALYEKLEEYLRQQHVLNANACIAYAREDNDYLTNDSMYFHKRMGYQLVGAFHDSGYKFGQWYDMIWMEKMLGEHTKEAKPFIPFSELK